MNAHEASARMRKVVALLGALDRNAAFAGIPPLAGSDGATTVRELSKADWAALAKTASVSPPSRLTVELVAEGIEARRGPVSTRPRQLTLGERAKSA